MGAWLERSASLPDSRGGLRFIGRREQPTFYGWSQVEARAAASAGRLFEAGVRPGDHVAIILPTDVHFADAFFGCTLLGAVPVPLYPPVRLGRIDAYVERTASMLRAVDAKLLITQTRIRAMLGKVLASAPLDKGVIEAETLTHGAPYRALGREDDLCMIQFSSGTTVAPKPVGLTHRQALANASRILDRIYAITPKDGPIEPAGVSWLPLYHDMGLIGCIFPAVLNDGPLTLIPPERFLADPAIWLRSLSRYKGTISPAPDFAYALCVERIQDEDIEGCDLSSWKMALDGAEPVSAQVLRRFAERFAPWGFDARALMPVYGLSEASLAVTFTPNWRGVRSLRVDADALREGRVVPSEEGPELTSSGVPLPDFEVEIRGTNGERLPEGRVGHLHASGPSLMRGYVGRADSPISEGWLATGDLGFLWDGELFVTGRAKDVIVRRGQNHAPQDLERAVDEVEGVRVGCSAAVADVSEDGERVLLFTEIRTPHEGQADACMQAVSAATGIKPDLIVLLEPGTLPRTSSGKIRRAETLRRWRSGDLTPPKQVNAAMLAGVFAQSAWGHLQSIWAKRS